MTILTFTPAMGRVNLQGSIKNPNQKVQIDWEVDGSSGSTICEAWRGQFEIDNLNRAGYKILSVTVHA